MSEATQPSEIAAIMRGAVKDAAGVVWQLYEMPGAWGNQYSTWLSSPDGDPESWVKVSGNYGPVVLADADA